MILEIENICCDVGDHPILQDVSFQVTDGEFLSVIGPNGAGKTTLLKCLDRILETRAGCIRYDGRPIGQYAHKDYAKEVAYVPQVGQASIPYRVRDYALMGRYPHLSPFTSISRPDREIVHAALELTGTLAFADRAVSTLSGGERQKVQIAAALTQEASVLLLDEPSTFLDPRHRFDIHRRLRRINREWKVTVVMVTHDINCAALLSDRILALKEGRVVFCGRPDEVMRGEALESIYDTPFLFTRHPQTGLPVVIDEEIKF